MYNTNNMFQTGKIKNNQDGFASLTIALVLVLVLSLITVGFAQLARREQQSALNKQLASQANYASESGINDVVKQIKTNPASISSSPTACLGQNSITPGNPEGNKIDIDRDVSYTCALVDLNPPSLVKSLDANSSWYTTFSTSAPLTNLKVAWEHKGSGTKTPKSSITEKFKPALNWGNHPAVLQVNVTPLSGSRDGLIDNSFTVYMYPASNNTEVRTIMHNAPGGQGKVLSGKCSSSGQCFSTITWNAATGTTGPFLLHIIGYYDNSTVTVSGNSNIPPTPVQPVTFLNAQAKVDVTGKARNVLKRLQVRVPLSPSYPLPDYAIEAQNICKRLETGPTVTAPDPANSVNTEGTKYIKAGGGPASSGDPCFLND